MKKMKRLLALVLAGVLALAMFTACGTPDDTETATALKEFFTEFTQKALPDVPVGQDPDLQNFLAEQTQENWSEKAKVFDIERDGGIALISVVGTFNKKYLVAFEDEEIQKRAIDLIKQTDDLAGEEYKSSATKAEVYTAARGNDVIISYVLFFPTAKTAD